MRYEVRRFFGLYRAGEKTVSRHRSRTAALKAAAKLRRGIGEGWSVEVVDTETGFEVWS